MAEQFDKTLIQDENINSFNAPIPGESLTASPQTPYAWERPPQYTDEEKAMEQLYLVITEKPKLTELIKIIDDGVALDEIAQVILYKGYTEGKFSPDMMLMLAEPTIYLLIAIADYADIKDYVLYEGEEDDPDGQIPDDDITPINMDEEETVETKITEPTEEVLGEGLLSRVKKELPSKIKEATKEVEE